MSRTYAIEALIVALERARAFAIAADLDHHYIAEIDHLVATAAANKEMNQQCQR